MGSWNAEIMEKKKSVLWLWANLFFPYSSIAGLFPSVISVSSVANKIEGGCGDGICEDFG
jgi:hypothetical protein